MQLYKRNKGDVYEVIWKDFPDMWLIDKKQDTKEYTGGVTCLRKGVRNKHMLSVYISK